MKPEIKQRIEQIKNGQVPQGYKKSKLGIVPIEWESTHFKNMFSRLQRKNTEGNTNVLTISAQYGLISQEEFFNKSVASDNKSNYFLLYKGEYAYNKSYSTGYPFGALKMLERYDKGIVSPLYICFSPTENNKCTDFYSQYFEAGRMNSEIKAIAQEGARNHGLLNISVDDFFNTYILVPPLSEQEKISKILSLQDKIIELQQKKIQEYQKLKKAMLQRMFPKKGENVPEIRFPGFTDSWEQRKFSDFTFLAGERNKDDLDLEPFAITNNQGFIAQSEVHDGFGYMKNVDRKMYIVVKPNSFAYNPARINVGSLGYYEGTENVIVSSLYEVFQTDEYVDDKFLKHWFNTKAFQDCIERLQEGSVRLYFYYDKLCECIMSMPSVEEQKKIGACLDKIDNLITLHMRKLEEMKKNKKSLMQLLLKGIVRV